MLPIDAAKTRLQTATPGSSRDVGVFKNLQMMYQEGEPRVVPAVYVLQLSKARVHAEYLYQNISHAPYSVQMTGQIVQAAWEPCTRASALP